MTKHEILKLKENLNDRKWRINNLYFIKDDKGNKVLFKMNKVQEEIFDNLWFFNIIPKARQLGVTTFFCIFYLDQILFSKNKTAGIIAHRQEDMKRIFRNKIKFAWDNLYPWLKNSIGNPNIDSANEMVFPNGSSIFVSMTTRSGTIQFLHISEFAYICQKYPDKADEIVSGSINSVHKGAMISIESTAAGKEGYFYKFCMLADKYKKEGRDLTELDFKIFFFPWWIDDKYQIKADMVFSKNEQEYFKKLEMIHGIQLNDNQKSWYTKKKRQQEDNMFSEYPSTLMEAFSVSAEGAYYSKEMNKVYEENRICRLPVDPVIKVDTYWDLGMDDSTVILFIQSVGPEIRFIDTYSNRGYGLSHYVKELEKRGYRYGTHYLPHDIKVTELNTGKTRKNTLYDMGLRNIVVGKKLNIQDGIEKVRSIFRRFYFDEAKTSELTTALGNYRMDWDKKLGKWKDKPRHDENSHWADAIRLLGQLWREPLRAGQENIYNEEKYTESFFT